MAFGDLSVWGVRDSPDGIKTHFLRHGVGLVIDNGFVAALKRDEVEVVAPMEAFDGTDVTLGDGRRLGPDLVVAATGYRTGLEPLVGHLGVLDERGAPALQMGTSSPSALGLHFVGLRPTIGGTLHRVRGEARSAAWAIALRRDETVIWGSSSTPQ